MQHWQQETQRAQHWQQKDSSTCDSTHNNTINDTGDGAGDNAGSSTHGRGGNIGTVSNRYRICGAPLSSTHRDMGSCRKGSIGSWERRGRSTASKRDTSICDSTHNFTSNNTGDDRQQGRQQCYGERQSKQHD